MHERYKKCFFATKKNEYWEFGCNLAMGNAKKQKIVKIFFKKTLQKNIFLA